MCQAAGTICAKVLGNEGRRKDSKPKRTKKKSSCKQANIYGGKTGFAEVKPSSSSLKSHFRVPKSPDAPRNPGGTPLQLNMKYTYLNVTYWAGPPQRILKEALIEGNA